MARLCPHWINYHGHTIADVALWHAPWVKVVDPDPEQCARLKQELGVKLLGRISSLGDAQYNEAPQAVAAAHYARIRGSRGYGVVDVWEALNEPGDLLVVAHQLWLRDYWLTLMDLATPRGDSIAWGCFSNGSPPGRGNVGEPDWSAWYLVAKRAGSRHPLALHEYWQPGNLVGSIPWFAGRYRWAPEECPILITECGANRAVMGRPDDDTGWRGVLSEEQYLQELSQYRELISTDPRVRAAFVYTYDYSSAKWESFDVSGLSSRIGVINDRDTESLPAPKPTPSPAPSPATDWSEVLSDLTKVSGDLALMDSDMTALIASIRRLAGKA